MPKEILISDATYALLQEIMSSCNCSQAVVIQQALTRLKREKFLNDVHKAYKLLRSNSQEWESELKERSLWDEALLDGQEDE